MTTEMGRVTVVTAPTLEPLTLDEAKKQVEVASSDTYHDEHLIRLIQQAREQWETDTDSACLTQTLRVYLDAFCDIAIDLPRRPIQSISTVKYYDGSNVLQTLSSSVYSLNAAEREVELAYNQSWPSTVLGRWDAVQITYIAGYTSRQLVPMLARQAMLLLVGYYFEANRGDNDRQNDLRAYENLVLKQMRSTYP